MLAPQVTPVPSSSAGSQPQRDRGTRQILATCHMLPPLREATVSHLLIPQEVPDPRPASEPWPTSGGPIQASPLVWLRQDSRPRAVRAADRATLRLSGQQAPPGPPEAGGRVLFPEYLQLQTPTYLASLCPSQSGRASLKPLTPTETQLRKSKVMRRLRGLV